MLHFINTTPTDWYLKSQATVETVTYGSEFVSARTVTEQIMDLRNMLIYLGVPLCDFVTPCVWVGAGVCWWVWVLVCVGGYGWLCVCVGGCVVVWLWVCQFGCVGMGVSVLVGGWVGV